MKTHPENIHLVDTVCRRYSMQKIQYAEDTVSTVSTVCSRYSLQKRMLTYSRKGKYHCKADLLFDWFAFDQTSKSVVHTTQAKQLKANKSNQMSVVQRHLHL